MKSTSLRFVTAWIDLMTKLDTRGIRRLQTNFELITTIVSNRIRRSQLFDIRFYRLTVKPLTSLKVQTETSHIALKCGDGEYATLYPDERERNVRAGVIRIFAPMTVRSFFRMIERFRHRPARLIELVPFIASHPADLLKKGSIIGIEAPPTQTGNPVIFFPCAARKKDATVIEILPAEAFLNKRKDRMPILPAGTRILIIEREEHQCPSSIPPSWTESEHDGE